jgi:hypothetical protein
MNVNYDALGQAFVSRVLHENSRRLSRTRSGKSVTDTSPNKQKLRLEQDALAAKSEENEERVHQFLYATRNDSTPGSASAVLDLLFALADLTNDGLLPKGRLREWSLPSGQHTPDATVSPDSLLAGAIPPDRLEAALAEFAQVIHRRWGELPHDPVPLASWTEWQLNAGPLHPFYDGCGRISRAFSALLLLRAGWLLPLHENIKTYFHHARQGPTAFCVYFRDRLNSCAICMEGVAVEVAQVHRRPRSNSSRKM